MNRFSSYVKSTETQDKVPNMEKSYNLKMFFEMWFWFNRFLILVSFYIYSRQHKYALAVMNRMDQKLGHDSREKCKWLDHMVTVTDIGLRVVHFIGSLTIFCLFEHFSIYDLHGWPRSLWLANLFGLIPDTLLLFIFIIHMIHLFEQQLFKSEHGRLTRATSLLDFKADIELLIDMKVIVNQVFGTFLLLSLLHFHLYTCLGVTYVTMKQTLNKQIVYEFAMEYSMLVLIILLMVYLVRHFESRRPSQLQLIRLTKNTFNQEDHDNNSISPIHMNYLFSNYTRLDYTPYIWFKLDYKFLYLVFLNALISSLLLVSFIRSDLYEPFVNKWLGIWNEGWFWLYSRDG